LDDLDLQINYEKSSCLRIGNRYRVKCGPILAEQHALPWIAEAKYVGISFHEGIKFGYNWLGVKRQFFAL